MYGSLTKRDDLFNSTSGTSTHHGLMLVDGWIKFRTSSAISNFNGCGQSKVNVVLTQHILAPPKLFFFVYSLVY